MALLLATTMVSAMAGSAVVASADSAAKGPAEASWRPQLRTSCDNNTSCAGRRPDPYPSSMRHCICTAQVMLWSSGLKLGADSYALYSALPAGAIMAPRA